VLDSVYTDLQRYGVVVKAEGEWLYLQSRQSVPSEILEELRQHKDEIIECLYVGRKPDGLPRYLNPPGCRNPFTPHTRHELPWECDPNSCYCFQQYGYPRFCQGAPCRWVWPEHTDEKKCHQLES
jgi:hypothetical protein